MFDPTDKPRVFATAPGLDFAEALVTGLEARCQDYGPSDWARIEIFANTTRMQRRIRSVFDAGPARLLPRIRLVTDLANDPVSLSLPPAVSPLRRRLELSQFVAKLLDRQPDLAPRAALYPLSESLAALMDEMQGEGVTPDDIAELDVTDQSGHWDRALTFLKIITPFFSRTDQAPDKEARQRMVVETLSARWAEAPPRHPVIIAGSTGSRGTTAALMEAIAKLPQGAIILPGFDFDLPDTVWAAMDNALKCEDHPQFRFRRLMDRIGFLAGDVAPWTTTPPNNPDRNALVSLSLRPAPVTDQWLSDGPKLGNLANATADLVLVEAPSPRAEAETIALRFRQAVEDGVTAALISPDRMLTRQVTAALDRWDIVPDDSAGVPLALSPPGRFLRHVAELFVAPLTGEALLTLLKHPLCHSGDGDRGQHLLQTRDLELALRKDGPAFPTANDLRTWATDKTHRLHWVEWLIPLVTARELSGQAVLSAQLDTHLQTAERLAAGPDTQGSGGLWDKAAGREARRICDQLLLAADVGGAMGARDYAALFGSVLNDGVVRDRDAGHPDVLIWGTLEARVQGVDLTILGGMNEGVWPEAPAPDPWLNRQMRANAGLLLPERRIGLSAHDYQQAMGGKAVWITRSKRTADAETVPSRWVNRLTNLLRGLPEQGGKSAVEAMRARGDQWVAMAIRLGAPDTRTPPATRPSPRPPPEARPDKISVTQIKTLIRDPFAIYARKVLRLDPLDPLLPQSDAALRGQIVHKILEVFIAEGHAPQDRTALMNIANRLFTERCPWPTVRAQWIARLDQVADAFLAQEAERQSLAQTRHLERWGEITVGQSSTTLTCKADRIDVMPDGQTLIYDYKTGAPPNENVQLHFDKQLLAEAAMVERGAFRDIGVLPVKEAKFLSLNRETKIVAAPLAKSPTSETWTGLERLFVAWQAADRGYTARMAHMSKTDTGPYDHLSRFGEWDTSQDATPELLK